MRSASIVVVFSLLVLSPVFTGAQGIRFKKRVLFSSKQPENELIHEERKSSLIKTNEGNVAEAGLCKEADGHCSTGMNRKLVSTASTTSTSTTNTKNDETDKAKATANSPSKSKSSGWKNFLEQTEESHNSPQDDLYVDITNITEMDYSPARRKPPIHN